jgi:hypothetical protein
MSNTNFESFFSENKNLVKKYIETRLNIYRLSLVKTISKAAGYFFWIIISVFLFFLFIIFSGLVTGFWLSRITGSYTIGFGITTLIVLLLIIILALFRKALFVNPVIKAIIGQTNIGQEEEQL